MWSLHSVTENVKKLSILGVVAIIIIALLWSIISNVISYLSRPAYVGPAMSFGQLPPIPFPKNSLDQKLTFQLNTVDGKADLLDPNTGQPLPISDRINVYRIVQFAPDLNSLQNADNKAGSIGFVNPDQTTVKEQRVSETQYSWTKTMGLPKVLTMDISNFNFNITSSFTNYNAVLQAYYFPTDAQAITTAQAFLTTLQITPTDIDQSFTTTTDYTINNNTLVPVTNANQKLMAVKVNFYQQAINGLPIVYPNPPDSIINFLVTGGDTAPEIAEAKYIHQLVDTSPQGNSTYPLKSSQVAYQDLQNGNNYYITPSYSGGTNQVNIKNISLAYYIGENPQLYLIPVYVFQGDNNFLAYVPALTDNVIALPSASPKQ